MVKYQPFYYKLVDHEIKKNNKFWPDSSAFTKKDNFGDVQLFIAAPTEYFTVKSEQEMDLASVIAMNFTVCVKSFSYISLV